MVFLVPHLIMRLFQPQWDLFVWQSIPGGAEWEGFLVLVTQSVYAVFKGRVCNHFGAV